MLTCISCSHSGQVTAENGIANEESAATDTATEGSSTSDAEVSKKAEEQASNMLSGGGDTSLAAEAKPTENPLTLGMEGDAAGSTLVASRETSSEAPTLLTAPSESASNDSAEKEEHSSSKVEKKAVAHPAKKSVEPAQKSTIESKAKPEIAPRPDGEGDEPEAIPVAEDKKEAPSLASAQISDFVERHAFIVTVGVVGLVFCLFIMMRRNKGAGDHLTL